MKTTKSASKKEELLATALALAKRGAYSKVTRESVATAAKVSPALLSFYFGTTVNMKREIMRAAIAREILEIIAQGLADGNPHARKAPDELKKRAVLHLAG